VLLAEHDELVRRSATLLGLRQLAGGCGRREALVPIIPRSPAGRLVKDRGISPLSIIEIPHVARTPMMG
jgi:hypothetical protein